MTDKKKKFGKAILGFIAFLLVFYLVIIAVGSGVLFTKEGIFYFVLLMAFLAAGAYTGKKALKERKASKKMDEILKDPEKLCAELKKNGTIIDDGKEINISVKEDPNNPERKILEIKQGKAVHQEWRKKYETVPVKKKSQNDETADKTKHLNTTSSSTFHDKEKRNNKHGTKS